jgi:hypothetical protein
MGEPVTPEDSDRFVASLLLLLAAVTAGAVSAGSNVLSSVALLLLAISLLVIYRVTQVSRRLQRIALVLVVLAEAAVVAAAVSGADELFRWLQPTVGVLLAVSAPAAILRRLALHRRITLQTVAGALSIYLLIGLFIAYLLLLGDRTVAGGVLTGNVSTPLALSDSIYFAFITLTTIGYGDIAPASGFARAVAMAGGLIGQLYLVSAVALVVGNLGSVLSRPER